MASSLLNAVNCTGAPNCTALNRISCSGTSHTCGACKSSRYIGDTGDRNTLCIDSLAYTASSKGPKGTLSCWLGRPCPSLQYCGTDSVCHSTPKSCSLDCSGPSQGSCQFFNVYSGKSVSSCVSDDLTCDAKCVCVTGFNGDTCSLSNVDLAVKKTLRDASMTGLQSVVAMENPSPGTNVYLVRRNISCWNKF